LFLVSHGSRSGSLAMLAAMRRGLVAGEQLGQAVTDFR
jgi:hypothetical protein